MEPLNDTLDYRIHAKTRQREKVLTSVVRSATYDHIHFKNIPNNNPRWKGNIIVKNPADLILYHQVIYENKPDWIIETGTKWGGSANFFADMMQISNGFGNVITIDIDALATPPHPNIEYIKGSSTNREIVEYVRNKVSGGKVMVVLDSSHARFHVKWELHHYSPMVTPGQYIVVEDCYTWGEHLYGPGEAVEWFLKGRRKFQREYLENQFIVGVTRGGWLKRV